MSRVLRSLRNIVRVEDWWFSKIPPLLAVALFLLLSLKAPFIDGLVLTLQVFASIFCVAAYGHIVNDVFDIAADAQGGKPNAMAGRSRFHRWTASLLPLLLGLFPGLFGPYPLWGWILLGLNYLWPTLYSLAPLRFKERGFAGLLLDAAGSHVTPTLFIIVVYSHAFAGDDTVGNLRFWVIAAWSAVFGIKGILYHQLADSKSDEASGTKTWARSIPGSKLVSLLPYYNLAIELPANIALVLAFLPWSPFSTILLLFYLLVETTKNRLGFEFALNQEPENRWRAVPFCNDLFYDCLLPLSVAIHIAIASPQAAWVPLLLIILFARNYRVLVADLQSVLRQLGQRLHGSG